jgi:hypothetical protein
MNNVTMTELKPAEHSRTYRWSDGFTLTLVNVTHFLARESGTHRLQTGDGKLHIVPVGWRHIEIEGGAFTL